VRAGWLPLSFAELLEPEKDATPPQITPPPELTRKAASLLTAAVLLALVALAWRLTDNQSAALVTLLAGICMFLLGVLPRDAGSVDVTDDVVNEISVPFARREMLKEMLFLLLPIAGAAAGYVAWHLQWVTLPDTPWLGRLAGVLLGVLTGGGVVWGVRVLGTLLFGKEAMGLGDVHLMAAVGAILGAPVTILAFFVAAFLGMIWSILLIVLRKPHVLPFGPWLSMASIICVVAGHPMLRAYFDFIGYP
jgi:prepilin signal peptidase PulO-like enzyme (type II secretory pathway)